MKFRERFPPILRGRISPERAELPPGLSARAEDFRRWRRGRGRNFARGFPFSVGAGRTGTREFASGLSVAPEVFSRPDAWSVVGSVGRFGCKLASGLLVANLSLAGVVALTAVGVRGCSKVGGRIRSEASRRRQQHRKVAVTLQ